MAPAGNAETVRRFSKKWASPDEIIDWLNAEPGRGIATAFVPPFERGGGCAWLYWIVYEPAPTDGLERA